jgi:NADH dehydrogenase
MLRYATRFYSGVAATDLRFVLVEASGRILPEVGEAMGRYTVEQLRHRGIEVRLQTRLESCVDGHVVLSDGAELDTNTLVWTAGVKPHPLLAATDLPLDDKGRVRTGADLRVEGLPGHWSAGDCAAVPDLTKAPGSSAARAPSTPYARRRHSGTTSSLRCAARS